MIMRFLCLQHLMFQSYYMVHIPNHILLDKHGAIEYAASMHLRWFQVRSTTIHLLTKQNGNVFFKPLLVQNPDIYAVCKLQQFKHGKNLLE